MTEEQLTALIQACEEAKAAIRGVDLEEWWQWQVEYKQLNAMIERAMEKYELLTGRRES